MGNRQLDILIVDDDKSLQKFFAELFEKQGHTVTCLGDPDEAASVVHYKSYDLIFIDCMLPKKNGVDLACDIKSFIGSAELYLMSGIFKDKKFAMESVAKTGALEFLEKPLDIAKVIKISEDLSKRIDKSKTEPILPTCLLKKNSKSKEEKLSYLKSLKSCHSLEIPFVLTEFKKLDWSGLLKLKSPNSELELVFNDGKVLFKKLNASEELRAEVAKALSFAGHGDEFTGGLLKDHLFNNCLVSPHESDKVVESTYVAIFKQIFKFDNEYSISIEPAEAQGEFSYDSLLIDLKDYFQFHLSVASIESTLLQFMKSKVIITTKKDKQTDLAMSPMFSVLGGAKFIEQLGGFESLSHLLEAHSEKRDECVRALYLLIIHQHLIFDFVKDQDFSKETAKLEHILSGVENKSPEDIFKFIGVNGLMIKSEIEKVFKDFSRSMHPDKFTGQSEGLRQLNSKIYTIVSEAYSTLTDDNKKEAYIRSRKEKSAEKSLLAETLMVDGMSLMQRAKYQEAYKAFTEAVDLDGNERNKLYLIWADIKVNFSKDVDINSSRLTEIYQDLVAYSSEEKRGDKYQLVLGLYHKAMGNISDAYDCFKKALNYNPNFLDARREVAMIRQIAEGAKKGKGDSIFTQDLSTVLGGLFKKKSS